MSRERGTSHEGDDWIIDGEADGFIADAATDYETRLMDAALNLAMKQHSMWKGKHYVTAAHVAEALKNMETCIHDQVSQFLSSTTANY